MTPTPNEFVAAMGGIEQAAKAINTSPETMQFMMRIGRFPPPWPNAVAKALKADKAATSDPDVPRYRYTCRLEAQHIAALKRIPCPLSHSARKLIDLASEAGIITPLLDADAGPTAADAIAYMGSRKKLAEVLGCSAQLVGYYARTNRLPAYAQERLEQATDGALRKGMVPPSPDEANAVSTSFALSQGECMALEKIGKGNRSAGLRLLIDQCLAAGLLDNLTQ